jgi:ribosomal protein S18 acetylase RimI-like enzyme
MPATSTTETSAAALVNVRMASPPDVPAVLALWSQSRSGHASVADGRGDAERLVEHFPESLLVAEADGEIVGEESLRRRGAVRVTALVAFEDEIAGGFWDAAGYPPDPAIGRRVKNL